MNTDLQPFGALLMAVPLSTIMCVGALEYLDGRASPRARSRLLSSSIAADGAQVYLIEDARSFVLHLSPPAFPNVVGEMVQKGDDAREALGPKLGQVIPPAIDQWQSNGVTCALFDQLEPISNGRLRRYLQLRAVTPKVLSWLRGLAELDRGPSEQAEHCLRALAGCPYEALSRPAAGSLQRVEAGAFLPRARVMHGDLWSGNILFDPTKQHAFMVIDWRGSQVDGLPIFDLIKFAESARLSAKALRIELEAHAVRLGCGIEDTRDYLLTALGSIWLNLDQFPAERFAVMGTRNLQTLEAALNE